MKKNIFLIAIMFGLLSFMACEKEDPTAILKDEVAAFELTAIETSYVLLSDDADDQLEHFTWTAPDYGFTAAVTYTLEMDVAGNDFSSPTTIFSTTKLTDSITVGEMNKKLIGFGLEADVASDLEFRVKATGHEALGIVYSNVIATSITPYSTYIPPIYAVGEAMNGWNWNNPVELRNIAPNTYYTIAYVTTGKAFRFFAQADWGPTSYNYPWFTTVDSDFENANDGDLNLKVLAPTGYYEITVNLQDKSVVMEPTDEPTMFMTGQALGGWNWDTDFVQMTWLKHGIFEATTNFSSASGADATFRFFTTAGWGESFNYPYFGTDGEVTPLLENANDGDKNFRFIGTTGDYKITVNFLDLIVSMEAAAPPKK